MTSSSKKKLALRRLAAATRSDGTVPCSVVSDLAGSLQVSCRQVRRWQAERKDADSDGASFPELLDPDATESPYGALIVVGDNPRGYIPTQKHLTVLAASPTRKAAWRTIASEPSVPGYRGFVAALTRLEGGLAGISISMARVLYEIQAGKTRSIENSNPKRVALGALMNAGHARRDVIALSDNCRHSLYLSKPGPVPAGP